MSWNGASALDGVPGALPVEDGASPRGARHREASGSQRQGGSPYAGPWLGMLLFVLLVQSVLAARVMRSNAAFTDEALYLYAGHDEIAHLLHGAVISPYETYFSGAPSIYPVLGAMADSVGGLTAARLLGLVFMLAASALLYDATSLLFDRVAGIVATALFVVACPTLFLSAFATYDPMALALLACAGWCAIRAAGRVPWLLATGLLLALADATKYASTLWNPVVLGLAVLLAVPRYRWQGALMRGGILLLELAVLIGGAMTLAGSRYRTGIEMTTLKRAVGTTSPALILEKSWSWVGLIGLLALGGLVLLLVRRTPNRRLVGGLLVLAVLLAPANQARIQVTTSLHKHVDFGAWFAAILAGYLLARLLATAKGRFPVWQSAVVALTVAAGLYLGLGQLTPLYQRGWPDGAAMSATMRGHLKPGGAILAENAPVPRYYLRADTTWQQWTGTWAFTYQDPTTHRTYTGGTAYERAIKAHYFSVVEIDHVTTAAIDKQIVAAMIATPGYRKVASVPGLHQGVTYSIWVYQPKGG